jgi:hypothetical protein
VVESHGENKRMKNIEMIRNEGIRVVTNSIYREVRKELTKGVRSGLLVHIKKDHLMPEIYCHPSKKQEAIELQILMALDAMDRIAGVMA